MKYKVEDFKFNEEGQMIPKYDEETGDFVLPEEALNYMPKSMRDLILEDCEDEQINNPMFNMRNDLIEDVFREDLIQDNESGEPITEEMILEGKEQLKKKQYLPNETELLPFGITYGFYPYMEGPANKTHPIFIYPKYISNLKMVKLQLYLVTSGKNTQRIFSLYDSVVKDWKQCGLHHKSYIRTGIGRAHTDIIYTRKKCVGIVSEPDIKRFKEQLTFMNRNAFKEPLAFLNWLINNKISDDDTANENLPIQSVEDIAKTRKGNCVDLAVIVYKLAKRHKEFEKPTIGWIRWRISDHKTQGHLCTMFKHNGTIYCFEYLTPGFGTFKRTNGNNYKSSLEEYGLLLKKNHPDKDVRMYSTKQFTKVFNNDELKVVDNLDQFKSQSEFLESIWPYDQFLGESKHYTSTRQFITEMLMDLKR